MNLPIMHLLADNRQEISRLCAELSVRKLRLFGSAVTVRSTSPS